MLSVRTDTYTHHGSCSSSSKSRTAPSSVYETSTADLYIYAIGLADDGAALTIRIRRLADRRTAA